MRIIANPGDSIILRGKSNTIKDCTIDDNGGTVLLGDGGIFTGNTVRNSGATGFYAYDDGALVSNNTIYNCNGRGINVNTGNIVIGNIVYGNQAAGIFSGSGGNTIKNNTAYNNMHEGIRLVGGGSYDLVDGNTAVYNNQADGGYPNITACTSCPGENYAP